MVPNINQIVLEFFVNDLEIYFGTKISLNISKPECKLGLYPLHFVYLCIPPVIHTKDLMNKIGIHVR
jgi:hypothetical protein